jgi:hypothetical protein
MGMILLGNLLGSSGIFWDLVGPVGIIGDVRGPKKTPESKTWPKASQI